MCSIRILQSFLEFMFWMVMHGGSDGEQVLAETGESSTSRARIAEFNKHFMSWYGADARPGRTAQFMGGIMSEGQQVGISSRCIFTTHSCGKL